MLQLIFHMN